MKRPRLKTVLIVLAVLLPIAALGVLFILPYLRQQHVYTDAQTIRQLREAAELRDILWEPPRSMAAARGTSGQDYEPHISADGQTLFFVRGVAGVNADIYVAQRQAGGWSAPQALPEINSRYDDLGPAPSRDGSVLYFYSDRPGGQGGYDLWMSLRVDGAWQTAVNLGAEINSRYNDYAPAPDSDGALYFASDRPRPQPPQEASQVEDAAEPGTELRREPPRDYDLYVATLAAAETVARPLTALNTPHNEGTPAVSPLGDFLYFASDRPGGKGGYDLYRSRRRDGQHLTAVSLGHDVNGPHNELDPALDLGGFGLCFSSNRPPAHTDAVEAGPYALYYTRSREVFLDIEQRPIVIDWAALWRQLLPSLLWALLALLAIFGLIMLMQRSGVGKPLGLLSRCLMASVIAHLLLLMLLSFWEVGNVLADNWRRGTRVKVRLASSARDTIADQVRAGLGEITTPVMQTPEIARSESLPRFDNSVDNMQTSAPQAEMPEARPEPQNVNLAEARVPTPQPVPMENAPLEVQVVAVDVQMPRTQPRRASESELVRQPPRPVEPPRARMPDVPQPAAQTSRIEPLDTAAVDRSDLTESLSRAPRASEAELPRTARPLSAPELTTTTEVAQIETAVPRLEEAPGARQAEPRHPTVDPPKADLTVPLRGNIAGQSPPVSMTAVQTTVPGEALAEVREATFAGGAAAHSSDVALDAFKPEISTPADVMEPVAMSTEVPLPVLEEQSFSADAAQASAAEAVFDRNATLTGRQVRVDQPVSPDVESLDFDPTATQVEVQVASSQLVQAAAPTETTWQPRASETARVDTRLEPVDVALPTLEERPFAEAPGEVPSMAARAAERVLLGSRRVEAVHGPTPDAEQVALEPRTVTPGATRQLVDALQPRDARWNPMGQAQDSPAAELRDLQLALPQMEELSQKTRTVSESRLQLQDPILLAARTGRGVLRRPLRKQNIEAPMARLEPQVDQMAHETSIVSVLETWHDARLDFADRSLKPLSEDLQWPSPQDSEMRLPAEILPPTSPLAGRSEQQRKTLVEQMGGSDETEAAVARALDWLARHQSPDGRWDSDGFDDRCGGCGGTTHIEADVALTGLALLTFLAADHTHFKPGPYQDLVERGLTWLRREQKRAGDLRGAETMYSHGIATIALAEALAMTGDKRLQDPVQEAVNFIYAARNLDVGGWRYDPGQPGDTSVLGWQVMALKSAQRAGVEVPREAFESGLRWLQRVTRSAKPGLYGYRPGRRPTPAMTAEAMFALQLMGADRAEPRMRTSAAYLTQHLPNWREQANTYFWYYATLALYQHQGRPWKQWNEAMKRELLAHQERDDEAAGSWAPADRWAAVGGRVYQTALCTLMLESYYRYLPMYSVVEEDP